VVGGKLSPRPAGATIVIGFAHFSIWAAYSVDAGNSPPLDLKNNLCRSEQPMKI
jgi:hypothetical protein